MSNLKQLSEPFAAEDVEWRVQVAGETKDNRLYAILVPYITNRAIMQRLDDVMTPAGWYNTYEYPTDNAVICGLSLKIDDEWITKWDGAEETKVEAVKGGLSNAMKRAAVQWGIGRYLYQLDSAIVTPQRDKPQSMDNWEMTKIKLNGRYERIYYPIPELPDWALPNDNQ